MIKILVGDCRDRLKELPDGSVQMCVTSPPYYSLRDYGHDNQIGLEPVHDCLGWATGNECGECFVCEMVNVFRSVWRVLRDDGVVFLNLGDSYGGGSGGNATKSDKQKSNQGTQIEPRRGNLPKQLLGIPWRTALALQADGWYLRSDIIWHKPSPMPESVTDRPTKAHEYLFLLAKSERYFYDLEAIKEETSEKSGWARQRAAGKNTWVYNDTPERVLATGQNIEASTLGTFGVRNKRSVWAANEPLYKLRDDITPEQRAYVLRRIADADLR